MYNFGGNASNEKTWNKINFRIEIRSNLEDYNRLM